MRRYKFLTKELIYEAFNRLRDVFLAAKDGNEVDEIINGLLTHDEKMKIGRRIIIAEYIKSGIHIEEIVKELKVGKNTIFSVMRQLDNRPIAFELIEKRGKKVEKEYKEKKYRSIGGSQLVFKKREYTGIKRTDIKR
ncbi:MAG: hypothetical protein HYT07_01880 [Candidatus Levybacteria bacterium]|nr:hypothetical protein [Candidatus Levybacteria bacterium]